MAFTGQDLRLDRIQDRGREARHVCCFQEATKVFDSRQAEVKDEGGA